MSHPIVVNSNRRFNCKTLGQNSNTMITARKVRLILASRLPEDLYPLLLTEEEP
jgi:hypothetical protein